MILIPPLGALSDRIGRKPLLIAGSVGFAVFAYPLFLLLNTGSLGRARSPLMPVWPRSNRSSSRASLAAGAELFATRVRSSGYSIGYNMSVALFGGTAPYVATWLVDRTGNKVAPAFYVIAAAIVTPRDRVDDARDRGTATAARSAHIAHIDCPQRCCACAPPTHTRLHVDNETGRLSPAGGNCQFHRHHGRVLRLPHLRDRGRPGLPEAVLPQRVACDWIVCCGSPRSVSDSWPGLSAESCSGTSATASAASACLSIRCSSWAARPY